MAQPPNDTTTEINKTTMVKTDSSDLMMIIKWFMNISSRSLKVQWASLTYTTPHIAKKIRNVIERTNYILDTLSIEYIQQAFTHVSSILHRVCSMQVSKSSWW